MKFLAVTACPSGVAQTYMAAEAIRQACKRAGIECKIETQGILGIENRITQKDVLTADAAILTTDIPIQNIDRFDKMEKVNISITTAIRQADAIVERMIDMLRQ